MVFAASDWILTVTYHTTSFREQSSSKEGEVISREEAVPPGRQEIRHQDLSEPPGGTLVAHVSQPVDRRAVPGHQGRFETVRHLNSQDIRQILPSINHILGFINCDTCAAGFTFVVSLVSFGMVIQPRIPVFSSLRPGPNAISRWHRTH